AQDHLGTVAIGEQRVAYGGGGSHQRCPVVGVGNREQDAVGDRAEKLLLALEVPVQRAGLHVELGGQPPHRQIWQADVVEQTERAVDDALPVVSHGGHHISILNGVQVNSVQGARWLSERRIPMTEASRPLGADLARIAVFAALIVVLGTVTVPLPGGVPITAQTLGVMLAGLVLGARRAPLAVLVVIVLAA